MMMYSPFFYAKNAEETRLLTLLSASMKREELMNYRNEADKVEKYLPHLDTHQQFRSRMGVTVS